MSAVALAVMVTPACEAVSDESEPSGSAARALSDYEHGATAQQLLDTVGGYQLCTTDMPSCDGFQPSCVPGDCQRDYHVCAAVLLAWAAASYLASTPNTAVPDPEGQAMAMLDNMAAELCSADDLCSDVPDMTPGATCSTLSIHSCPGDCPY